MDTGESSIDQGRLLAQQILEVASSGDRTKLEAMLEVLDAAQLRALVGSVAEQVSRSASHVEGAHGPAAVCTLAVGAAAPMFGTTAEAIRSSDRSGPVADARAVAMSAARDTGLTLRAIGEALGRDHSSVNAAVHRVSERPRLADAAAQVSAQLTSGYQAPLSRRDNPPRNEPASTDRASPAGDTTLAGAGPLEHAVAGAAAAFAITPAEVLGEDRHRGASDARAVAMTAARLHGCSLPAIARHFDRDHTAVLDATRRMEKLPPLYATAQQIASEIPEPERPGRSTANRSPSGPRPEVTTRSADMSGRDASGSATHALGPGLTHEHKQPPGAPALAGRGPAR